MLKCMASFTLCQSPPHPNPCFLKAARKSAGMSVIRMALELKGFCEGFTSTAAAHECADWPVPPVVNRQLYDSIRLTP